MNTCNVRRLLLLIFILILSVTGVASAASTVFIMEDTTVYAKPDTDSKRYGTLEAGKKYTMVDSGNGWAKLQAGNSVGYVRLEDVGVLKKYSGQTVYVDGGAALLASFESSSLIMSLADGTSVSLYAIAGDWAYIKVSGKYGLVKVDDLTTEKPAVQEVTKDEYIVAYAVSDGVKVYKSNSASSKVLMSLDVNAKVKVFAAKNGWVLIEVSGKTGYMKVSDLSVEKVSVDEIITETFTAYVKKDGAKAYDSWNGNGNVVRTFKMDDEVTVRAYNSTWANVKVGGNTMFMYISDLSREKNDPVVVESFTAYVKADGIKGYDAWDGNGKEIKSFKVNDKVTVQAYNNTWARVKYDGKVMFIKNSDLSREKIKTIPDNGSTVMPATGTAKQMDWWESNIRSIIPIGKVFTITDVSTGIAWQVKRSGGTNHADIQPLTAADTAAMKKAYGGSWSWNRRAVFVTVDGVNYAGSINGMPHGNGNITDNDFSGHHCLHFTNSRTHGTNKVDSDHQNAIRKAAGTTLD